MNLKKGILRIIVLALWLLLGAWFVFYLILPLYLPTLKFSGYWGCLLMFLSFSAGLAILIIYASDRVSPVDQQFLNLADLYTRIVVVISIITGLSSVVICNHLISLYSDPWLHPIGPRFYILTFVIGYLLIFSSYVFIRWIVKGFRD
jgi:hypothetical protein